MARFKNVNWNLPTGGNPDNIQSWDALHAALLMDIRDELQEIAGALRCHRIQRMFKAIDRIDKRLATRLPLQPRKRRNA